MQQSLVGRVVVLLLDSALRLFLFLARVGVDHLQQVVDCFFDHDVLALQVGCLALDFGALHLHEVFERNRLALGLGESDEHLLRDGFDVLFNARLNEVIRVVDEFG